MKTKTAWIPATLLLALSAFVSRLLGVLRDHLLARAFGAAGGMGIYNLDAYYAAFRIPDLIYNLLIFGTLSSVLIPMVAQYRKQGETDEAWKFSSAMMHLTLLIVLALSLAVFAGAPWLVKLVAAGFEPSELAFTARLMRLMVLSPIFFTLAAVPIALQDAFKTFWFRSLGPLFYNLGIIGGIVFLGKTYGVVGVTWGVIAGACMQFLIQLPALAKIGYRHHWILGLKRPDVKQAFKIMAPRILGPSLPQITLVINTLIASFFTAGSITVFYLADNLQGLPFGIIGVSFAVASFATLSELAAEPTPHAFAAEARRVMHQILFWIVPASVGMALLRHEIIDIILRNGKFTAGDAALTAQVLLALIISLFAQALLGILNRGFYAYHDTRTPFVCGLIGTVMSILGSVAFGFYGGLGVVGIALGWSAGMFLNFGLQYGLLSHRAGQHLLGAGMIARVLFSSAVMALGVHFLKSALPYEGPLAIRFVLLGLYALAGAALYFMTARVLSPRS